LFSYERTPERANSNKKDYSSAKKNDYVYTSPKNIEDLKKQIPRYG